MSISYSPLEGHISCTFQDLKFPAPNLIPQTETSYSLPRIAHHSAFPFPVDIAVNSALHNFLLHPTRTQMWENSLAAVQFGPNASRRDHQSLLQARS